MHLSNTTDVQLIQAGVAMKLAPKKLRIRTSEAWVSGEHITIKATVAAGSLEELEQVMQRRWGGINDVWHDNTRGLLLPQYSR